MSATCEPLKNPSELANWRNFNVSWFSDVHKLTRTSKFCVRGVDQLCHDVVFKPRPRIKRSSVPRTLVCHDMKGGYLQDKYVNDSPHFEEYKFFHWNAIDVFVYFSHKFVTIPPIGWINAGHLHGVKVLGTIITEWNDGILIWNELLKDDASIDLYTKCLADICAHFSFDGYLLNVENKIDKSLLTKFLRFIDLLSYKLHMLVSTAELIWYDSVTKDGSLQWQNELNGVNRIFFDKCDGIFLNYTWNENQLASSLKEAGVRAFDVFVGVDVHGRNFYQGGGFRTSKAMDLIKKYDLSVAIFAPGWVYECFECIEFFPYREYGFWSSLSSHLYVHGPKNLPFMTSFCQGYGQKFYSHGVIVSNFPWFNLRKQQFQPCILSCIKLNYSMNAEEQSKSPVTEQAGDKPVSCLLYNIEESFQGGGCLKIQGVSEDNICRLLICEFECHGKMVISVVSKSSSEPNPLEILLLIEDFKGKYRLKKLVNERKVTQDEKNYYPHPDVELLNSRIFNFYNKDLPIVADENSGWKARHYLLNIYGRIIEIGLKTGGEGVEVLLGYLSIYPLY